MRAPEAPIGWPSAIAPPLTLIRAGSRSSTRVSAQAAAEKAVGVLVRGQNGGGLWNYNCDGSGRNDTTYSSWCAQALKAALGDKKGIVRFGHAPGWFEKGAIETFGARVVTPLPGQAYLVSVPPGRSAGLSQIAGVDWATPYLPQDKISPEIAAVTPDSELRLLDWDDAEEEDDWGDTKEGDNVEDVDFEEVK